MAVAFDRPEPTFRKTLFKGYQGKRPEMDDALVSQIPKVQDMVRAFGIPIYEAAGYEADDVLGSIAAQIQTLNFKNKPNLELSDVERRVLEVLALDNRHVDEICRQVNLPVSAVSAALIKMEIYGLVKNMGAGVYLRLG